MNKDLLHRELAINPVCRIDPGQPAEWVPLERKLFNVSDLMFIQEVSAEYRIPEATLRWWIATGKGGPRSGKLGKRVVFKRADVEAFVESGFSK